MMVLLLLLATSPAHAACEAPADRIATSERLIVDAKLAEAKAELDAARAALACSSPATADHLARLWLAEAVVARQEKRDAHAREAFAAAARVAPALWVEGYGKPNKAFRDQAVQQLAARPQGSLALSPEPQVWQIWVDGSLARTPLSLPAGLHAVQLAPAGGDAVFARTFLLQEGETLTISVDVAEPPPPPVDHKPTTADASAPDTSDVKRTKISSQTIDQELLEKRRAELQRSASREWGSIDSETEPGDGRTDLGDIDARAERLLEQYIARYELATVRVSGVDVLVEIPQVQEAQNRLASLPQRRAKVEQLQEEERALQREFASTTKFQSGFGGASLGVAATGLHVAKGSEEDAPSAFRVAGPSLALGASLALSPRFSIVAELIGASGTGSPDDSVRTAPEGWEVEEVSSSFASGTGALAAHLALGRLGLFAGPMYSIGRARSMGTSLVTGPQGDAEISEVMVGTILQAGLRAGASYRFELSDRLGLGPNLSLQLGSDAARVYTSAGLGISMMWLPATVSP